MNKYLFFLIGLFFSQLIRAYDINDDITVHGFFTQNAILTSANNVYGDSEHSLSTDFTEAGVNVYYTPLDKLSFSFQALYRNAGEVDEDKLEFDYGFVDLRLNEYAHGLFGIRLGRIKNPLGLYNETRDVAFTTPSIILPQGIYFDRSRALMRASDGLQLYFQHRFTEDNVLFKFNYGKSRNDNDELLHAVIPLPTEILPISPQGKLKASSSSPGFLAQVIYEQNAGEIIYALSYADVLLRYEPGKIDFFSDGTTDFQLYVLSMQYNGEKLTLTSEYKYQKNNFSGFGVLYPDVKPVSESWYIQGEYRLKSNWQIYARYDEQYSDKDNRSGKNSDLIGNPRHMSFSKSAMFGLRWDVNPSMMLRAEYHNVNGTAWLTSADNPDRSKTQQYWDIFALQLSLRF